MLPPVGKWIWRRGGSQLSCLRDLSQQPPPSKQNQRDKFINGKYLTIVCGFRLLMMKQPFAQLPTRLSMLLTPGSTMDTRVPGRQMSHTDFTEKAFCMSSPLLACLVVLKSLPFLNLLPLWMVAKNHHIVSVERVPQAQWFIVQVRWCVVTRWTPQGHQDARQIRDSVPGCHLPFNSTETGNILCIWPWPGGWSPSPSLPHAL